MKFFSEIVPIDGGDEITRLPFPTFWYLIDFFSKI